MHLVKRKGHIEKFDKKKIHKSCYNACLGSHLTKKEAEKICIEVSGTVEKWIKTKPVVTSEQIFREVVKTLKKHHKEVAFMYETHRDIS